MAVESRESWRKACVGAVAVGLVLAAAPAAGAALPEALGVPGVYERLTVRVGARTVAGLTRGPTPAEVTLTVRSDVPADLYWRLRQLSGGLLAEVRLVERRRDRLTATLRLRSPGLVAQATRFRGPERLVIEVGIPGAVWSPAEDLELPPRPYPLPAPPPFPAVPPPSFPEVVPFSPETERWVEALHAFRAGDVSGARAHAEALLAHHPDGTYARHATFLLGEVAYAVAEARGDRGFDPAVELLRRAISGAPASAAAHRARYLLARAQAAMGRVAEAEASYREALALGAHSPYADAARLGHAALLLDRGEERRGQELLARFDGERGHPMRPLADYVRGVHAFRVGRYDAAVRLLASAFSARGDLAREHPAGLFLLAECLLACGRDVEALTVLDSLAGLRPSVGFIALVLVRRSDVLTRLGRDDEAVAPLEEAASRFGTTDGGVLARIRLAATRHDPGAEDVSFLETVVAARQGEYLGREALLALVALHLGSRDYDAALEAAARLLGDGAGPRIPGASGLANRVLFLAQTADRVEGRPARVAARYFRHQGLHQVNPGREILAEAAAESLVEIGLHEQAALPLLRTMGAPEGRGPGAAVLLRLAGLYLDRGDSFRSRKVLELAQAADDPRHLDPYAVHLAWARCLALEGDASGSRGHAEAALRAARDPVARADALLARARARETAGDRAGAAADRAAALREAGASPEPPAWRPRVAMALGRSALATGNYGVASASFLDAVRLAPADPGRPALLYRAGDACLRSGDVSCARAAWQEATDGEGFWAEQARRALAHLDWETSRAPELRELLEAGE